MVSRGRSHPPLEKLKLQDTYQTVGVNIEDWQLQSLVAVEQQPWLSLNDMIADRVTD
jgi:hypothetical protein